MKRQRNIEPPQDSGPWWRHGFMWLVVGGPLLVVVAALVTAVIAVRGADVLVDTSAAASGSPHDADVPALKARNHVVTPRQP